MDHFGDKENRLQARIRSAVVRVRLRRDDLDLSQPALFSRDISSGGLGLVISGEYPGAYEMLDKNRDPVTLAFDLPDGDKVEVSATVVWGVSETESEKKQYRVGLKFQEMDERTRWKINGYVGWLARGTGRAADYRPEDGV